MNSSCDLQSAKLRCAVTCVPRVRFVISAPIQVAFGLFVLYAPSVFAAGDHSGASGHQTALEPMAMGSLVRLTVGLVVVLAAIVVVAWFMKRLGRFQSGAGGAIKVVGGLSMSARERVVLVQVGQTQLLLGVAPGRVQTLHVLQEPIADPNREVEAGRFAEKLRTALEKRRAS